jgi:hypothetical protein
MLLMLTAAAQAGHDAQHSCKVEVLYSEELPIGPLFHHTVKAALLVTPPGAPPFETTVVKVMHWQVPPPRRGQQMRVPCDSVAQQSFFALF